MTLLRPIQLSDAPQLLAIYRDAVLSQTPGLYNPEQIRAWAGHPEQNADVREALIRGQGLVSLSAADPDTIEAFALRNPLDRLALLYCRGRASRQGRGRSLVLAIEQQAREQGCQQLRTEASQLSRPLLERLNWQVEAEEEVLFAGVHFRRWRMIRELV